MELIVIGGVVIAFVTGWSVGRAFPRSTGTAEPPASAPADAPDVESLFTEVLDRHATGVVVASPSGAIAYRNEAALALGGTHVGVLVDEAVARHLAAARDGDLSSETLELYGPPRRVIVVSSRPLPSGRSVAFVDDISDRHRADQARTDFVANVSHELRTPIGALTVLAETLVDVEEPEVIARVVARMQGEAERAARTIDDLLELSQIEGGLQREFGPVRLSDVVRDAVGRVAELAAASDITLSTLDPVGPDGPVAERSVVQGDRRQLASAIGNLLENAVKYSDPGDVVQVRVRRDEDAVVIAVTDEGVGIPRRDLDRVFERFYRVDRARSRSTGGTGLGLSIVRHVASNHGGAIAVDSIEGEGSTFALRLPLPDVDAGVSHQSETDDENDQKNDHEEGVA